MTLIELKSLKSANRTRDPSYCAASILLPRTLEYRRGGRPEWPGIKFGRRFWRPGENRSDRDRPVRRALNLFGRLQNIKKNRQKLLQGRTAQI